MKNRRCGFVRVFYTLALGSFLWVFPTFVGWQSLHAQTPSEEIQISPEEAEGKTPPPEEAKPPAKTEEPFKPTQTASSEEGSTTQGPVDKARFWKDIVVIPRKPFLKMNRWEFLPFFGVNLNDNLIQHFSLGGEVNYFLTDILSIGLHGSYYFSNMLDEEFLIRYHFEKVPSLNKYKWTGVLQFGYVPIYGKFTVFNSRVIHYDIFLALAAGVTQTEIIPRDLKQEGFSTYAITIPVGMGARVFLTQWMAIQLSFRDYIMIDRYESATRGPEETGAQAQDKADGRIVNNLMFNLGVSFFLPTSFKYTSYR